MRKIKRYFHRLSIVSMGFILTVAALHVLLPQGRLAAQGSSPSYADPTSNPVLSPYRSLSKIRQFLDYITIRVFVTLNYEKVGEGDGVWKTPGLSGIQAARYYQQNLGNQIIRTVEVAVMAHPQGGFEIYIYGQHFQDNVSYTNPDLPGIHSNIQQLAETLRVEQQKGGNQQIGYEVYQLSYIQSDRALALLKALGYTTTEYTEQAGETIYERVFAPYKTGEWKLPAIIKLIDAPKTSLMAPSPVAKQQQAYTVVPDIGGTFLHHTTSGEPLQRFLIIYDLNNPEPMEQLLNLLREKIDVPARQIVLEAMVIEINTERLQDMGLEYRYVDNKFDMAFEESLGGLNLPFTFIFNEDVFKGFNFFEARLKALLTSGDAEILSSPSILALDGRQARIQIGQQIPVVKSTATAAGIISTVEYFPVGIVLNIRPRITEDGSEITMQVETIVSSVTQSRTTQTSETSEIFLAPTIDNRQVQTFVRIADNTPFIIGGLISTEVQERLAGIPVLSQIPVLGALFRRTSTANIKKEVIVVLTPHVVPLETKSFSYVIPRDSHIFNSFDHTLFRNAYRIRDDDIFDLKFIYESEVFSELLGTIRANTADLPRADISESIASMLDGQVPGEDIFIRRMLWEIVFKTGFHRHIDINHVIVFQDVPDAADSSGLRTLFLSQLLADRQNQEKNSLLLKFDMRSLGTVDHPFALPKAGISYDNISGPAYIQRLMLENRRTPEGNRLRWSIILSETNPPGVRGATAIELLQGIMVLKRILALNSTLPLTVKEFRVGRQIILPTESDLRQRFHVIDRDIARYFYEAIQYYPEFEKTFNIQTRAIVKEFDSLGQ